MDGRGGGAPPTLPRVVWPHLTPASKCPARGTANLKKRVRSSKGKLGYPVGSLPPRLVQNIGIDSCDLYLSVS